METTTAKLDMPNPLQGLAKAEALQPGAPMLSLVAYQPQNYTEAQAMAKDFAESRLTKVRTPAQALLIMATGAELGIPPAAALRTIDVIDTGAGERPALSADIMVALCLRRRDLCEFLECIESSAESATYITRRRGAPLCVGSDAIVEGKRPIAVCAKCGLVVEVKDGHADIHRKAERETFTQEMRKRAKLGMSKERKESEDSNWAKYPEAMLRHRASSFLARKVYPDILAGFYTADELHEMDIPEIRVVATEIKPLSEQPAAGGAHATPPPADCAAEWERRLRAATAEDQAATVTKEIVAAIKDKDDPTRKRLAGIFKERKASGWKEPAAGEPPHDPITGEVIGTAPADAVAEREPGSDG